MTEESISFSAARIHPHWGEWAPAGASIALSAQVHAFLFVSAMAAVESQPCPCPLMEQQPARLQDGLVARCFRVGDRASILILKNCTKFPRILRRKRRYDPTIAVVGCVAEPRSGRGDLSPGSEWKSCLDCSLMTLCLEFRNLSEPMKGM